MIFFSKKYKVKREDRQNIELHEIFLDHLTKNKEEELDSSGGKLEVLLNERIIRITFFCFLFFIFVLFFRVFFFQVIQGEIYAERSERNKNRIQLVTSERGIIYDKNMNQLVWNSPAFDLLCDKRDLFSLPSQGMSEMGEIAEILEEDFKKIKKIMEESENPKVLISSKLSHQEIVLLETKIKDFPGCEIQENFTRTYVEQPSLFNVLGFTGRISKEELQKGENYSMTDYMGKTGIEKYYENVLRGEPGKVKYEKDAFGRQRDEEILSVNEPGKNLILHLDKDLQKKAIESLEKYMEKVGAEKASFVALDPQTGGVLSMVSIPSPDNNFFGTPLTQERWKELEMDSYNIFLNRVTSGGYLVGSTIKPFIGTAALEEEIISPEKSIFSPLSLCLLNRYTGERECFRDWEFHGWTDMRRAIAESVNPYFYMLGGGYIRPGFADSRLPSTFKGLGDEKMREWLNLFGWGERTGIDLPGEISGVVPDSEWKRNYFKNPVDQTWTIGDNYNLSIGQSFIRTTPLQVVTAYSSIANGGILYKPQMIKKIADNSQIDSFVVKEPEVIREDFIDPENLEVIREGMRQAVTDGSARLLNNLPVTSAAKTGTAQIPREDHFHHWVSVFAPYEDPEIVFTVLVEEVDGIQSVTLPVANEILEWYFE